MTTNQLIQDCKRGVARAQKELYISHAPRLLTLCRRYAKDEPEAKDFLQESFAQIFKKLSKLPENHENVEAWMYTVARNMIINILRKRKMKFTSDTIDNLPDGIVFQYETDDKQEQAERALAMLQKLPEKYRTIINLNIIEGYTHIEIAEILGIKDSTSRSQLTRALQKLRDLIHETHTPSMHYEQKWI